MNDVKAAAMVEVCWGHLQDIDSGLFLNWGTGIALAICCHGAVWSGAHGASGEIAYSWIPKEVQGYREGHAPFEEAVGGGAIARRVREDWAMEGGGAFLDRVGSDPRSRTLWNELLDRVAWTVGSVLLALDVERVVISGGLARRFDLVGSGLRIRWEQYLPFPPEIVLSQFVDGAGLLGGLAAAWSS